MMMTEEDKQLLAELKGLREAQQELLAEYRRVANESLAIQKQAFETQRGAVAQQSIAVDSQLRIARLYRAAIGVAAVLVAFLLYRLYTL
jgi:hypothetical protein